MSRSSHLTDAGRRRLDAAILREAAEHVFDGREEFSCCAISDIVNSRFRPIADRDPSYSERRHLLCGRLRDRYVEFYELADTYFSTGTNHFWLHTGADEAFNHRVFALLFFAAFLEGGGEF